MHACMCFELYIIISITIDILYLYPCTYDFQLHIIMLYIDIYRYIYTQCILLDAAKLAGI